MSGTARAVLGAEATGARLTLLAIGIARDRAAVLVDVLDGLGSDAARGLGIALQPPRLAGALAMDGRRHAAVLEHARHAAHGVGAAAEAEQIDAVARLPDADDLGVAVDDVLRDAEARRLRQQVVDAAPQLDLDALARGARAEPAVVEGDLALGIDAGVGRHAGGAQQLVDVAAGLVGHVAARLAGAVGENEDVLGHSRFPTRPRRAAANRVPFHLRRCTENWVSGQGAGQPPSTGRRDARGPWRRRGYPREPGGYALLAATGEPHHPRAARSRGPLARQHMLEDGRTERAAQVGAPLAPVEALAAQRPAAARERVEVDAAGAEEGPGPAGGAHGVTAHVENAGRGEAVEDPDRQIARQVIVAGAGAPQLRIARAQGAYAGARRARRAASGLRAPLPRRCRPGGSSDGGPGVPRRQDLRASSLARWPLTVERPSPASCASSVTVSAGPASSAVSMLAHAGLPIRAAMREMSGPSFIVWYLPNYGGVSTCNMVRRRGAKQRWSMAARVTVGAAPAHPALRARAEWPLALAVEADETHAAPTRAGGWCWSASPWRVVCWGFGFYGHAFYLVELQRLHGWPTSLISSRHHGLLLRQRRAGGLHQRRHSAASARAPAC